MGNVLTQAKTALVGAAALGLLLSLAACFLLNVPPVAVFVASTSSGSAPLVVTFDASGSSDSDGTIESYRWTLGDGEAGLGNVKTHTYTLPGTYIVHLTVTDNDGATAKAAALTVHVLSPTSTEPSLGPNNAPVASFAASPVSGTAPLDVGFDATSSSDSDGTIVSYVWSFGDGGTSSGVMTSRTYASPGTYTARLTITDDEGATGTITRTIQVTAASAVVSGNNAPSAGLTASPTSGTAPLDVDFDASASSDADGAIVSSAWDFGDGGSGSGVTASHTYNNVGTYTAMLTVTDNDGAQDTATQTIHVAAPTAPAGNSAPVASFTASPMSGTAPLDVTLDASASADSDGTIVSYAWSYGDGGTGSGVTATHTYNSNGTYVVQLTVTDDDGAADAVTRTVDVTDATPAANEPPIAGFYSTKQSGEPPLNVRFYAWYSSDADGTIVAYAWDFGDGSTSSGHTTSHTYTDLGTYTVTLTVTDNDGATDDAMQEIRVSLGGC